jgi:hypothetical protein
MKLCLLVRAYSTNLFGYRDVSLGPVCVVVCVAAIAVGSYTHCVYLYCRNALLLRTRLNYHTRSSTTYYLLIHPFIPCRTFVRAHTHTIAHTYFSKHVEVIFSVCVILISFKLCKLRFAFIAGCNFILFLSVQSVHVRRV